MTFVSNQAVFGDDVTSLMCALMRERSCKKGTTLVREGDSDGGLYFIQSGVGEIQVPSVTGEVVLMHLVWPGTWVGEGALLSGGTHMRSMVARTDLEYAYASYADMKRYLEQRPDCWRKVGQIALSNQRIATQAYVDAAVRNPLQRCAATLLRLAGFGIKRPLADLERKIPISQSELGGLVNLCRNSTAKILGQLEDEGIALAGYRQIIVPSVNRLAERLDRFDD